MFYILADSESFACQTKVLLDSFERCDKAGWIICSEEVPGVEPGKVLKGTEELVTTDCNVVSESTPS